MKADPLALWRFLVLCMALCSTHTSFSLLSSTCINNSLSTPARVLGRDEVMESSEGIFSISDSSKWVEGLLGSKSNLSTSALVLIMWDDHRPMHTCHPWFIRKSMMLLEHTECPRTDF